MHVCMYVRMYVDTPSSTVLSDAHFLSLITDSLSQLFRSSEDSDIYLLFTTSTALHTDEMIHYRWITFTTSWRRSQLPSYIRCSGHKHGTYVHINPMKSWIWWRIMVCVGTAVCNSPTSAPLFISFCNVHRCCLIQLENVAMVLH